MLHITISDCYFTSHFVLTTGNPRKSAQGGITGLGGQNEQK